MLRKLYKLALLPGLLLLAAGPEAARGQVQPVSTVATNVPMASPEAAIWAATANYVYQDDPELKVLLPELLLTTRAATIEGFKQGLNKAVKLENKKPKDSHVFMFQTQVFQKVQQLNSANAPALAAAIEKELLAKHPERQGKPAFQKFSQEIKRLASPAGTVATNATPDPAADSPMSQIGAPPAEAPAAGVAVAPPPSSAPSTLPAGLLLWLALGAAGLSLLGVLILWNKLTNTKKELATLRRMVDVLSQKPAGSSAPPTLTAAIKQEITRQIDQRVAEKQATATVAPASPALAELAPAMEVAAEAPAPRLRTQYVGEAPFNNIFPARALSDQPSTYSMFAIESSEQQPDQGTFAVTGNLASHVRDHRTVLEPVCEYVGGSPLGNEMRVVTEQPGLVRRRGDDWEVVQRARIHFE